MKYDKILLEHGSGGRLTGELISEMFVGSFKNTYLDRLEDSALLDIKGRKLCFTTDSYVVSPIFFPGGDIGSLAVHGTVNDLCVCGGMPQFLSAGFIIEEGLPYADLKRIVHSMATAAEKAGVKIVTGDTKVVPRGSGDGIFINTSGIGVVDYAGVLSVRSIQPGDAIIVNGMIGDHGAAILSARESLISGSEILSDSAPLNGLVQNILEICKNIHCMRDATRGGLGAILAEMAKSAGVEMIVTEKKIPVNEAVRGICEVLGFDPLFLANEGKLAVFCPENEAAEVLNTMKEHEYGKEAAIIGKVEAISRSGKGRVILETIIGGERMIDLPVGELVPRIC